MNIFTFVQENAVVYGVKILVAEAKVMLGVWVNKMGAITGYANVTGMNDCLGAMQCSYHFGPQQAVRVGDQSENKRVH